MVVPLGPVYGFVDFSYVTLRYMVLPNTFPNNYISQQLDVSPYTYSISGGGSKEFIYNVGSLATPAPMVLSADTVFIHSLTFFHLTTT